MRITALDTFILHVPVSGGGIADGRHRVAQWGAPGVRIRTDTGLVGTGYTGTHAHLPTDRMIVDCIEGAYAPLLLGADPREVQVLWTRVQRHPPLQWVGRSGITHLAHAAVDVALWDLKAQAAGEPLWRMLGGGGEERLEAYDTDGGWLDRSETQLLAETEARLAQGYRAVKIKVGSRDDRGAPDPGRDLRRAQRVHELLPPGGRLMVDANGAWDLATALEAGRGLDALGVAWLEEPIWYDDLPGHARLARELATPIALGEQLYTLDAFRDFIAAGAVHYVQADAVRLAGISEWWRVAELAHAHHLPVVPHIGDMMQVHLQLAIAHPACALLEHIPWMRSCFVEPATVRDGLFVVPERPGAGTALRDEALERYAVAR
ncbi:MAG: mandelate racemase/muconate lactonizing enzyme family protein [Trueperaceae bacterium]